MNWRAIRALALKDLRLVVQNRGVMLPMILVPLIFTIVIPVILILTISGEEMRSEIETDVSVLLGQLPPAILDEMATFATAQQRILYLMIVYQLAPMFLILPLMTSSVIGADSFAGEKERKTVEALIYTPLTDVELYAAKMLAAWVPAVIVALGGALVYGLAVNLAALPVMERVFFPNFMWLLLVVWVAPAAAGLGLAAMVLVSSRVRTFQAAYQVGGLIVLPLVILMVAQFSGALFLNVGTVLAIGLILWLVDIGLLALGARTFRRTELIAQL